jgi:hypothetical protein
MSGIAPGMSGEPSHSATSTTILPTALRALAPGAPDRPSQDRNGAVDAWRELAGFGELYRLAQNFAVVGAARIHRGRGDHRLHLARNWQARSGRKVR